MADDVIIGRIAVKVMPDTSDFRAEARRRLAAIEESLDGLDVRVELDSAGIRAQARRVQRDVQRALKTATIRVNLDNEASVKAGIARVQRQLDDLGATGIELKTDADGLKGQLRELQGRLAEVGRLRLRVDPKSETSLHRAIDRIDGELAARRELAVNVKLDKASLEKTRTELQRRLDVTANAKLSWDRYSYQALQDEIRAFTENIVIDPKLDDREVRAKLREIERTIEALNERRIEFNAAVNERDKRAALRDIEDLQDKLDQLQGDIQLQVKEKDKLQVGAALAVLVRDRVVKIVPEVSKSAAAKVGATLAALSGARAIGKIFDDLWASIKNLDRAAPLIGTVALAVANLGSVGIASASNLASLAASLASIGPAALALPGIFGGLALGIVASAVALKDINKYLPEFAVGLGRAQSAGQAWKSLQDSMSAAFWAKFTTPLKTLVESLFPQFSAGMQRISGELGGFFGSLATGFTGVFDGALAGMFADLSTSIRIASGATGELANIVKILGETGAGYLPRLAAWFAEVTTRLSDFLTAAATGGQSSQLNAWIDTAIQALTDLGHVLAATGSLLYGLGKAATAAGGSTLATLAGNLQHVSDVVNSAGFQASLVNVFAAVSAAIDQLTSQAGPALERFFSSFANSLQMILPMAGEAFGRLLGGIADALAQPAFQHGLVDLFAGIGDAVRALTPALGPLGQALGAIGTLLGTFLTALAPNLATVLTVLAQAVIKLGPALGPVVTLLGQGLAAAIGAVAPLFDQLVQAITGFSSGGNLDGLAQQAQQLSQAWAPIVPMLGDVLVSAFRALGSVIPPVVSAVMQIGTALAPLVQQILPTVGPLLEALGATLGTVFGALGPFAAKVIEIASAVVGPLLAGLIPLISQHLPQLGAAFARLLQVLGPVLDILKTVAVWIGENIVPAIVTLVGLLLDNLMVVINGLVDVIAAAVKIIKGIWDVFAGVFTGDWKRVWNGIKGIFSGVWDAIVALLKTVWAVIVNTFTAFAARASQQWKSTWETIKSAASSVWNWLKATWSSITGTITSTASRAWETISSTFSRLGSTLKSIALSSWNAVTSAFTSGVRTAVTTVAALPGKAVAALRGIGSTLVSAGKSLIRGFVNGIKAMFGSVKATLGDLTAKLTSWKGPPARDATLLTGAGRLVIDSFIDGMESRYGAVRASLRSLTSDIARTPVQAPDIPMAGSALTRSVTHALEAGRNGGTTQKILNYYAAPGSSIDSEQDLFAAAGRARMVGW